MSSYVLSFISHLLFIHRLVIQISSKEEFYQKRILLYCKISNFISQEQYSTCYMKCPTQYMVSKYEIRTKYVKLSGLSHFVPRCTLENTIAFISLVRIKNYFLFLKEWRNSHDINYTGSRSLALYCIGKHKNRHSFSNRIRFQTIRTQLQKNK